MGRILAEVVQDDLSLSELLSLAEDHRCGAQTSFVGVVRKSNNGKEVVRMRYDAEPVLAELVLKSICEEAQSEWGEELNLLVRHRIGVLELGEASVAIVVSAPHRGQAFSACRYVIEQIKLRVPIWKEEYYADGETQWLKGVSLCSSISPKIDSAKIANFNSRSFGGIKTIQPVILVGGQSSRMGQNKAELPYRGKRLVDYQASIVRSVKTEHKLLPLIVSGEIEGYRCLPDIIPHRGPVGALYTLFQGANSEHIDFFLLLAVDMPQMDRSSLEALLLNLESAALLTHFADEEFPALYAVSSFTKRVIGDIFSEQGGDCSLKAIRLKFGAENVKTISRVKEEVFLNVNTPADWAKCQESVR